MCYTSVKRLTVVPPGEYSNKPSVKSRTHKLSVALPGDTRQYFRHTIYPYIDLNLHLLYLVLKCGKFNAVKSLNRNNFHTYHLLKNSKSCFVLALADGLCCAWLVYPVLRWYRCPEIGTSSIDWVQLSRFHLKTETESSLRNAVFWNINRSLDNIQKHNICIQSLHFDHKL
jgi:hypothetical protein